MPMIMLVNVIELTASKLRTPETAMPNTELRFIVETSASMLLDGLICGVPMIGLAMIEMQCND